MPIVLSTTRAPLLITTATGNLTDDEYREHLEDCTERIVKPKRVYAYVYDGTGITNMSSVQRRLQAKWIETHKPVISKLNKGCGFAFDSIFTRGLLTAVHWITPPPYPYSIHAKREQAVEWCLRLLRKADLTAPGP